MIDQLQSARDELERFDRQTEVLIDLLRQREDTFQRALDAHQTAQARYDAACAARSAAFYAARSSSSTFTMPMDVQDRTVHAVLTSGGLKTREMIEDERLAAEVEQALVDPGLNIAVLEAQQAVVAARSWFCGDCFLDHWPLFREPPQPLPDGRCSCKRDIERAALEQQIAILEQRLAEEEAANVSAVARLRRKVGMAS